MPGRRESNADTKSISVGQRDPTPGFFTLRFSHRFQRIAKAPLIWYLPAADGLGVLTIIHHFLKHTAAPHSVRLDGGSPTALVSDSVGHLSAIDLIPFFLKHNKYTNR